MSLQPIHDHHHDDVLSLRAGDPAIQVTRVAMGIYLDLFRGILATASPTTPVKEGQGWRYSQQPSAQEDLAVLSQRTLGQPAFGPGSRAME